MSTNKKITPMKGAGTLFYRLKNEKEATVVVSGVLQVNEVKKDANWDRIAKIKELQPGEITAESYEDNYLDDANAEWKGTSQGAKSAGETSITLAWLPGDTAQQAIVGDFDSGKKTYYMVKYPNGTRDVYYAWVSSLGKTVPQNETMTRTIKLTNVGKPSLAENNNAGDE
ncbi:phage tail protein [Pasteurella multocida]|uniref:phage tail tube protein n=1 Tax=Pasteurella multocida TaxID=747 RepID=UPI00061A8B20|nr:phage tail tube protein [Pasteurella multocida]AKD38152.1 putative tail component of prophage [Pasteurella multocida subsp. multocida OH4807]URH94590.1 phage tail protein [Pasteurella multocida]URH94777.1 phage tail protein [Pasteurella multocida]URI00978.1 phage tail protein [Pasteurella multocida]URI01170.1 phage tail protein [Pasteurella multocida]